MTFKTGAGVLPGTNAIDTAGRSPGYVSFEVAGGDGLVLVGDAIMMPQVLFAILGWKFGYHHHPVAAIKTRGTLLDFPATDKKKASGL